MFEKRKAIKNAISLDIVKGLRAEYQNLVDQVRLQYDWILYSRHYQGKEFEDRAALKRLRQFIKEWTKDVNEIVNGKFGLDPVE